MTGRLFVISPVDQIMEDLKKLQWRCRRGTLELDIICRRYLDQCYQLADEPEREAFLRLLELEDDELLSYLMGNAIPEPVLLVKLVEKMRSL